MRQRAIQEAGKWQDGSLAVEYMWHGMCAGAIEPSWLLQWEVFGPRASPTPLIWVMPIVSPPGSDRPLFSFLHDDGTLKVPILAIAHFV
ncbi:MAG TPA: hypothetical protein VII61_15030 [Ktedonobacteraceae bacterium]